MEVRTERNAWTEHAPFSLSLVAACIPWKAVRSRETPRWKQRRLVTELFDDCLNGTASPRPETNGNEQGWKIGDAMALNIYRDALHKQRDRARSPWNYLPVPRPYICMSEYKTVLLGQTRFRSFLANGVNLRNRNCYPERLRTDRVERVREYVYFRLSSD